MPELLVELPPFCGVFPAVGGGFPDAETEAVVPHRVPKQAGGDMKMSRFSEEQRSAPLKV
jgi:hypothetical protein